MEQKQQSKKSKRDWSEERVHEVENYIEDQLRTNYQITKNGCWLWKGNHRGEYGKITRRVEGTKYRQSAHIASYQYYKGAIPNGLLVCHSCDNKPCMNPDHLWLGTNRDNQIDAARKGISQKSWTRYRRRKYSKRMQGDSNPMLGKKHSPESRLKMSVNHKSRKK